MGGFDSFLYEPADSPEGGDYGLGVFRLEEALQVLDSGVPFFLGCGGECFASLFEQVSEVAVLCLEVG